MPVKIHNCDVMQGLAGMPDNYFDCVVTSPPYWGLRDYGVAGQLGMEATLGEHLAAMVAVFAEVHRVLKPSGVLWLNYGDCYASAPNGRSAADTKAAGTDDRTFRDKPMSTVGPIYAGDGRAILKPKDLCMIPNRLAIALQEWGWWCRSECIWAKPNPMPESIKDRPATSHEKIFMLTKSGKYFYNAQAVRRPLCDASVARLSQDVENQTGSTRAHGGIRADRPMKAMCRAGNNTGVGWRYREGERENVRVGKPEKQRGHARRHAGFNDRWDGMTKAEQQSNGRSLRNWEPPPLQVWEISTSGFKDAHFATFPPELVERCLMAGCPEGGTVLDPFGGAGTTALVGDAMGMDCHLIELNSEYAKMALRRIEAAAPLVVEVSLSEVVQADMFPVDTPHATGAMSSVANQGNPTEAD